MKLYFRDLPCYQNLSDKEKSDKLYNPNHAFNLARLPNTFLMDEFAPVIFDRAALLSFKSLRSELTDFHNLADFLSEKHPDIKSLTEVPRDELEREITRWLFKNGKQHTVIKKSPISDTTYSEKPSVIRYMLKVYEILSPSLPREFTKESDIWEIEKLPFPPRASPIKNAKTLSFKRITQDKIKAEVKEAAFYRLRRKALSTVTADIAACEMLSIFLFRFYPEIESLSDFNRDVLEAYLEYIYLTDKRKKNYRSELHHLKSMLSLICRLFEYENLEGLFLQSDFSKKTQKVYKAYSKSELDRIHAAYKFLDEQTARALMLHELLGTRISDTLTITEDDINREDLYLTITQQKTGNTFKKTLTPLILALIDASIRYTKETYGKRKYIFVAENDPDKALSYGTIYTRIRKWIKKCDIRDDHGNLINAKTHTFRCTYGKKLCDLDMDDATIAALLGHKGLTSVAAYRKMSSKKLAENTRSVVDQRNTKIKQFRKGWAK